MSQEPTLNITTSTTYERIGCYGNTVDDLSRHAVKKDKLINIVEKVITAAIPNIQCRFSQPEAHELSRHLTRSIVELRRASLRKSVRPDCVQSYSVGFPVRVWDKCRLVNWHSLLQIGHLSWIGNDRLRSSRLREVSTCELPWMCFNVVSWPLRARRGCNP